MTRVARIPDCHPEREHMAHGQCRPCYGVDWRNRNRGHVATYDRSYQQAHPELRPRKVRQAQASYGRNRPAVLDRTRAWKLTRVYNLTVEEYDALLAAQGGTCAICRQPETATDRRGRIRRMSIDHDHETGELRGLLCQRCNTGLGMFLDRPDLLMAAVGYLALARKS